MVVLECGGNTSRTGQCVGQPTGSTHLTYDMESRRIFSCECLIRLGTISRQVRLKGSSHRRAVVRYIGETQFATGIWVGVELAEGEEPTGNNDGAVNGVPYFECPPARGIFLRPDMIDLEQRAKPSPGRRVAR